MSQSGHLQPSAKISEFPLLGEADVVGHAEWQRLSCSMARLAIPARCRLSLHRDDFERRVGAKLSTASYGLLLLNHVAAK
jgi:hypothetical protein